jgi:hypothetical protein
VNISKLRELERAATTPQWDREVRAAIASLLKVAEAAKKMRTYRDGGDDFGGMGPALNNQEECAKELDKALAELEAQ